jgi:hypothetical protein
VGQVTLQHRLALLAEGQLHFAAAGEQVALRKLSGSSSATSAWAWSSGRLRVMSRVWWR